MNHTCCLVRDRMETSTPTMGVLYADAMRFQTLEPPWKDNAQMISCIPPGTYPLGYEWSNKFSRKMPILQNVPGRSTILIHPLNNVEQTQGCVGIGELRVGTNPPTLAFGARAASEIFNSWLRISMASGPVSIEISYADGAAVAA